MRRILVLGLVAMALALLDGAAVAAPAGDEAAVAQAVEAFRHAMLQADRSQLEALCVAQLSYGHSGGRVENKPQFIDGATSGRSRWKFITLTDQTVQIVGDTAIVRHTLTGETERDGQTNPIKLGVLMVWHKRDGHWQLLARQAVRPEEPRTN
jgi:ketosteroid isomerase-like protein